GHLKLGKTRDRTADLRLTCAYRTRAQNATAERCQARQNGTYGASAVLAPVPRDHPLRVRCECCGAHLTGYNRLRVEVFECGIGFVPWDGRGGDQLWSQAALEDELHNVRQDSTSVDPSRPKDDASGIHLKQRYRRLLTEVDGGRCAGPLWFGRSERAAEPCGLAAVVDGNWVTTEAGTIGGLPEPGGAHRLGRLTSPFVRNAGVGPAPAPRPP